jgi:hypothetical protein
MRYPSGGGGNLLTLLFDLGQEHPLPQVGEYVGGHLQLTGNTWSQEARHSITPDTSLPINIEVRSPTQLTAFMVRLVVEVDGRRVHVLIDDEGKPFRLLGDRGASAERHFVWRWDLGGFAERGADEVLPQWKNWRAGP